jgi:curved DNA-binding protein CbpA
MNNPYQVLKIKPGASLSDIKAAYRSLVRQHHPDKGGNPEDFRQVQEAYEQLTKPKSTFLDQIPSSNSNAWDMDMEDFISNLNSFDPN